MKYEYVFKQAPEVIVGANKMVLATTEYGDVIYTPDKLIVPVGKTTRYEYSYCNNSWVKIVVAIVTFGAKPPILRVDNLDVKTWLFFSMIATDDCRKYYRTRREQICYPIVNRGKLWYDRLTLAQRTELNDWYEAWLDVTDTLVIPAKPSWLEDKLNKIEPEELL